MCIRDSNKATGDAYQMALLANVAFDMGKKQDYKVLTEKLYSKFSEHQLKSETNFMEGSGKSLSAEVLALYAISLLKSDEEQLNLTKIIDALELSDGYYSTQSKVLVLKALSDYYSKFNVNTSNAEPLVKPVSYTHLDVYKRQTYYRLRIFRNTANKILNDLDRLLEEPHGCFEQTSSTTYPNYFVLNYLKSKGKVDENLEQKALKNLKHGYNRLVNFETSENGFSLFGSKPANVSLTAFGLMEFNDLKNVIHVDEKMLERTKKFVLSKRNPNGTFNLSNYESYGTKTEYYWAKQAYILSLIHI